MLVLGWHGSWYNTSSSRGYRAQKAFCHDSAAVLLREGKVVAAIEEERLSRLKHTPFFPARAITFCLSEGGISLADLDAIATGFSEQFWNQWAENHSLAHPSEYKRSAKQEIAELFARNFGADVIDKLFFCQHHLAHLYSACFSSGFSDALCICLDGVGETFSGAIAHFQHNKIKILRYLPTAESFGQFYLNGTRVLGYGWFDEYKVMGLAPYGDPAKYEKMFGDMYKLLPEGRVAINSRIEMAETIRQAGLSVPARRTNEPFTQQHKDFAAGLQISLERMIEHVIKHFWSVTGSRHLCLSGGVAHNCSANGRFLRSNLFDGIYVQPAAHDAGNALGAALSVMLVKGGLKPSQRIMPHVYLGTDIGSPDEIEKSLISWHRFLTFRKVSDASTVAAELIANGSVIGWVQGRSEFGPRALGNRSILADPRPLKNRNIINQMVKKREGYRPFAPSILKERLSDYFEIPTGTKAVPFMTFVLPVKREMQPLLGAVTHVDGSARVQSVSRDENPSFYSLIEKFGHLTGVPIVLNTSFNNNVEPIVDSVHDAITCFLTTNIHALIIGDWLVEKTIDVLENSAFWELVPQLAAYGKLVRSAEEEKYLLEWPSGAVSITRQVFDLLLQDNATNSKQYHAWLSKNLGELGALKEELFELWQSRAVVLRPLQTSLDIHRLG